ncbi:MAG: aminodeoxychorismate/anthranilate synthase component II [Defluviitaleaceae bacterium]|nr:aminodeoxychorismate/anthranilate synthase component II [Defluviitaleaceae bacterium]
MLLLIDNYDSFSYNLYQLIGEVEPNIKVIRNDAHTVAEIAALTPEKIILSPGPGKPSDAGVCIEVVRKLSGQVPILGICLGHQAIYEAFGGVISYAAQLMHGKSSEIAVDATCPIFAGLPPFIQVARYHSLAGVRETLPAELKIVAHADDGEIMAISHKEYPVYGLQFHPESILTPAGKDIIRNFLSESSIL